MRDLGAIDMGTYKDIIPVIMTTAAGFIVNYSYVILKVRTRGRLFQ